MQNVIDRVAQASYKASCEEKRVQGYHQPGECPTRFGCEKCRHMPLWEVLPPSLQDELRSSVQSVIDALEALGYRIVPGWWLGEVPQHATGAIYPGELLKRIGHTNIHCKAYLGEPCTCIV